MNAMITRQWILLAVVVVLALSLVACNTTPASPTPAPTETPPALSGVRISTLPPPATSTPVPATHTPVPPAASATPGCILSAGFVADVTVPDGASVAPNSQFVKTWRVKNSGTCDWGAGAALVFAGGDQLGGPASVAVPAVASGGTRDLSVNLKAPAGSGAYKGRWQLRTASGETLTSLTVSIVVAFTPTPTGPPTATPKPSAVPTYAGTIESFVGLWLLDETLGDPQRLQQLKVDQSDSKLLASPATTFGSPYSFGLVGFASTTYQGGDTVQWDFDDPALGHVTIRMTINKACNAKVRLSYPSYPQRGFILYNVQSPVSCQ
jgi:hypothetical protein